MFKRANKITALLVAAASVMSVVPAMAADSTTRLGTKDGTLSAAVAYKDGKYVYEGYRSDSDSQGLYYNGGSSDKQLDGLDSADLKDTYGTGFTEAYDDKYASALDGSDEYLIDLSDGSVVDGDTAGDKQDTAKTKLTSALKKTDRYNTGLNVSAIEQIKSGPKFGEVWYTYTATPTTTQDNSTTTGSLYGFTNNNGKYIDASNLAGIYAYSTTKGKTVKIDEFDNPDSSTGLTATLTAAPVVLTQDKDYIYAKVVVKITDTNANAIGTTTTTSAGANNTVNYSTTTDRTYIQKIAKAQGDKKDDAYLPKTVQAYEITTGEFSSSNATDAEAAMADLNVVNYTAVNGELFAITDSGSNIKVTSLKLTKDKVKYDAAKAPNLTTNSNGAPVSFGTTDKVDVYLVEKDDSDDVDYNTSGVTAYDVDVDGNVWVVADGKIYKFENNTMTKTYTCDSSLDEISVYDANNLITWEKDGSIYTTVNEGTAQTAADAGTTTAVATPAKVGWDKLADGTWNFYDATGTKVASNWVNVGGAWYYLKADGVMATGWFNDNGTWYFLKSSGAMATGWLNDNGTWYYLNASGAMLANTTVDGYVLSASGAWVK